MPADRSLSGIVSTFLDMRVLIVGDVMLDEYIWGDVRRISPEAPVPIVQVSHRTYGAGGAANVAANVVSLGGQALLCGVVGLDPQAASLRFILGERAIPIDGLVADGQRPTTTKTRILAHDQQVVRVDAESRSPLEVTVEDAIVGWVESHVTDVDACVLSDYDKGVVSLGLSQRIIRVARQADKPMIVDPKGTNYTKYRGATVITPNVHEAARAAGRDIDNDDDLCEAGRCLAGVVDDSALLITRGAQGMSLFLDGMHTVHIPTVARKVFDVTGAGDTVVSTLAMALAGGAGLQEAAYMANLAAGIVVGKLGAATVTPHELLAGDS